MKNNKRTQIFYLMEAEDLALDSAEIVLLTTDSEKLKAVIATEIRRGNLEYEGDDLGEMENNFLNDWKGKTKADINERLRYGYYGYGIDGEYGQIFGEN